MSAGSGIVHSEYNLEDEATEIFQIWILPNQQGVPARWETVKFPAEARDGALQPLASGRGHAGAIPLYADGALYAGTLKKGQSIRQKLDGKPAYLVPARGSIEVSAAGGTAVTARARDGVAVVVGYVLSLASAAILAAVSSALYVAVIAFFKALFGV